MNKGETNSVQEGIFFTASTIVEKETVLNVAQNCDNVCSENFYG
jgi:hypothetical protein